MLKKQCRDQCGWPEGRESERSEKAEIVCLWEKGTRGEEGLCRTLLFYYKSDLVISFFKP